MIQKLAEKLLIRVYHEMCAVVSLDEQENILDVSLSDTRFGGEWIRVHLQASCALMMFNHPDGNVELIEEEIAHVARFREVHPFLPLHVYVTGEDIGAKEVML